jgi:alpha-L-fucosidase
MADELGAIGHFNMGTYSGCGIGFGEGHSDNQPSSGLDIPPPQTFAPTNVDVDGWVKALASFGAQRAVLVVSHGCGFNTFPSDTAFPEFNFEYNYSVKNSPWKGGKGDIARDFVAACKKYGIRPGFYHGAMNNAFLNVRGGKVGAAPVAGQAKITQAQYTQILLANLKQLWTSYGELAEVWFDGGM